jgi:hypothetical protein
MPITATLNGNSNLTLSIDKGPIIQAGDLLYAMDRQADRIYDRTVHQNVDFAGNSFTPYNDTHPYYWYPFGSLGSRQYARLKSVRGLAQKHDTKSTPSGGIRFDSYAAFKRALGRVGVDLFGPSDPHMMNAMAIFVNGVYFPLHGGNYDNYYVPATSIVLGIYGPKGKLAEFHNTGMGSNPERRFFAISSQDRDDILNDVIERIKRRLV